MCSPLAAGEYGKGLFDAIEPMITMMIYDGKAGDKKRKKNYVLPFLPSIFLPFFLSVCLSGICIVLLNRYILVRKDEYAQL